MLLFCWRNRWRWYCCSIFRTAWRLRLVPTMRPVVCLTCDPTKRSPCTHTTTSSAAFRQSRSRAAADCCLADTTTSTVISGTHSNKIVLVCMQRPPIKCIYHKSSVMCNAASFHSTSLKIVSSWPTSAADRCDRLMSWRVPQKEHERLSETGVFPSLELSACRITWQRYLTCTV